MSVDTKVSVTKTNSVLKSKVSYTSLGVLDRYSNTQGKKKVYTNNYKMESMHR